MRVYQCIKCGLIYRSKKQIIAHLKNSEGVTNPLLIDSFYQIFDLKLTKREMRGLL